MGLADVGRYKVEAVAEAAQAVAQQQLALNQMAAARVILMMQDLVSERIQASRWEQTAIDVNGRLLPHDALAQQTAVTFGIRHRGALRLLLDAKRTGLVPTIVPSLDQPHALRFHLSSRTRTAILDLAGEAPLTGET